uniref:Uncharacterized protein n=1 Tax=Meloidogyne javanica TaxID=6303 RepID=A0A915MWW2_MELJA
MDDKKSKTIDLTCTTAIYAKEINFYELDFANKSNKPSCILLNNSGLAIETSKVSHAEQNVDGCKSYINSQNNDQYKVEQIFDQNKGDWNITEVIVYLQKGVKRNLEKSEEYKRDKIVKRLHAKYVEAKRTNQIPMASVAADEVNYEFDLNVISARQTVRYFKMFSKQNINPDICQVNSKHKHTEVDSERMGSTESHLSKKSKVMDNSAHNSNQADKAHESGFRVQKIAQMSNVGTSAQTPNYFIGESQFNDNRNGNGLNSLGSHNEFFVNKADELTEDDLNFWNEEEPQDMRKNM